MTPTASHSAGHDSQPTGSTVDVRRRRLLPVIDGVRRRPLLFFFAGAYLLSAVALAVIGLPHPRGATNQHPATSLIMFPVIVFGVGLLGVTLTAVTAGRPGLRELRARLSRPVPRRWWPVVLIPPAAILLVLSLLDTSSLPNYRPGFLPYGVAAGVTAGFVEELGWTGFAYPRLRGRLGPLAGALLLGGLWGLWHFPVVDSLGAASPHGAAWSAFFAAFVAVLVALRVLIAWVHCNTGSLRLAQALHGSSTGFLVVLGASAVTPRQEALWYAGYAGVLWLVVAVVLIRQGPTLGYHDPAPDREGQSGQSPRPTGERVSCAVRPLGRSRDPRRSSSTAHLLSTSPTHEAAIPIQRGQAPSMPFRWGSPLDVAWLH